MDNLRQIGIGILLAAISIFLILGALFLALAEGKANPVVPTATYSLDLPTGQPTTPGPTPTDTATAGPTATVTEIPALALPTINPNPTLTPIFSLVNSPTPSFSLGSSATPIFFPTISGGCNHQAGWTPIIVQQYQTLNSIAIYYNMTSAVLMQGNCLTSDQVQAGMTIYVIPRPVATTYVGPTAQPCGPPAGWVNYTIAPGDTLTSLSLRYRVSVASLQSANCLGSSTNILAGQNFKVPYVVLTSTPVVLPTSTSQPTAVPPTHTPAPTSTPAPPTAVPTATPFSNSGPG